MYRIAFSEDEQKEQKKWEDKITGQLGLQRFSCSFVLIFFFFLLNNQLLLFPQDWK